MNFQKKVPVQRVYLQTDWNAIVLLFTALSCGAGGHCYVPNLLRGERTSQLLVKLIFRPNCHILAISC